MKRILSVLSVLSALICCAVFAAFLARPAAAFAAEGFVPQRINNNTQTSYLGLDGITALCAGQNGVYIADQNAVYYDGQKISDDAAYGLALFEDSLLILQEDGLYVLNKRLIEGSFNALAVADAEGNSVLYLGNEKTLSEYSIIKDGEDILCTHIKDRTLAYKIEKLCPTGEGLFGLFADTSSRKAVRRIAQTGLTDALLPLSHSAKDICAGPENTLLYLTLNSIEAYRFPGDKAELFENKSMQRGGIFVCRQGENIYIASETDGVDKIEWASFERKALYASYGADDWFFDTPSGVYSRRGIIYTADTYNDRLAVYNQNTVEYIGIKSPVSAIVTSRGERIIAHDRNVIINHSSSAEVKLLHEGTALKIEKLAIDSLDDIYVLASDYARGESYIYKTTAALDALTLLDFTSPAALSMGAGGTVYIYDGAIKGVDGKSFNTAYAEALIDFYIDYSGKIFGLNTGGKLIISDQNNSAVHDCGTFNKIAVKSTVTVKDGAYTEQNELLLLDTAAHSLFKLSGAESGIVGVSGFFNVPVPASADTAAHAAHDKTVAKLLCDATLFALPVESNGETLSKGSIAFIRYDIPAPADMYYVAAEDKREGKSSMLSGYIYTSAVNTPFDYQIPNPDKGKILLGTKAYIYPSRQAGDIGTLAKGSFVRLLSFYSDYTDKDGKKWFRIVSGDNEAFIPADGSVDFTLTSAVSDPPNTNAKIITDEAVLYTFDEINGYVPIGVETLKKGVRVQAETPFDSNKKYTKIEVLINGQKYDIDCYVETRCLKYDGIDITKAIVIGVIVFIAVLLIVLVVWFNRRRHRRVYARHYTRDEEE